MTILQELEKLNREISAAEREFNRSVGKLEAMTSSLKKEFGIDYEDVDTELIKIRKEKDRIANKIEKKFSKLKEEYSW